MPSTENPKISLEQLNKIIEAFKEVAKARSDQAFELTAVAVDNREKANQAYQEKVSELSDPHALLEGKVSFEGVNSAASTIQETEKDENNVSSLYDSTSQSQAELDQLTKQGWPVDTTLATIIRTLISTQEAEFAKTDLPIIEDEPKKSTEGEGLRQTIHEVIMETFLGKLPEGSLKEPIVPVQEVSQPAIPEPEKDKKPLTKPERAKKTTVFDWSIITNLGLSQKTVGNDLTHFAESANLTHLLPKERGRGHHVDFTKLIELISGQTFREFGQVYGDDNRYFGRISRLIDLVIRLASSESFQNGQIPDGYKEWLNKTVSCIREETGNNASVECHGAKFRNSNRLGQKLKEEFVRWQAKNAAKVTVKKTPVEPTVEPATETTDIVLPEVEIDLVPVIKETTGVPQKNLNWDVLLGVDTENPDKDNNSKQSYNLIMRLVRMNLPDKPWSTAENGATGKGFRFLHNPILEILSSLTMADIETVFPLRTSPGRQPIEFRSRLAILIYRAQSFSQLSEATNEQPMIYNNPQLITAAKLLIENPDVEGSTVFEKIKNILSEPATENTGKPEIKPAQVLTAEPYAPHKIPAPEKPRLVEPYKLPEDLPVTKEEIIKIIDFAIREWCELAAKNEDNPIQPDHLKRGLTTGVIAKIAGSLTHGRIKDLFKKEKLEMNGRQKHAGEITYTAETVLWQWLLLTHYSEGTGRNAGGLKISQGLWKENFNEVLNKFLQEQENHTSTGK